MFLLSMALEFSYLKIRFHEIERKGMLRPPPPFCLKLSEGGGINDEGEKRERCRVGICIPIFSLSPPILHLYNQRFKLLSNDLTDRPRVEVKDFRECLSVGMCM